jgi:hypothetical protein
VQARGLDAEVFAQVVGEPWLTETTASALPKLRRISFAAACISSASAIQRRPRGSRAA